MSDLDRGSVNVQTRFGGHSMSATFRTVMMRLPAPPESMDQWQEFGYTHPIDHNETTQEHEALRTMLLEQDIDVLAAGPDEDGRLDGIFAYDPSMITDHGAILLRMGKDLRVVETERHAETYRHLGVPILGAIRAPGMVEGGDTLWIDDSTLAVGRGYRTNQAGIDQLTALLGTIGVTVLAYDLPHWNGAGECLHLMSLISPVDARTAVVYRPMMAVAFVQMLEERGWDFVDVPDDEFDSMACNVLAIAPRKCVMLEGNPETRARLEAQGCEVFVYKGDQISRNRQGGPTCLTRPIYRSND